MRSLVLSALALSLVAACGTDFQADSSAARDSQGAATDACTGDCDGAEDGTHRCTEDGATLRTCVRTVKGCLAWRDTACSAAGCDAAAPDTCIGASCISECSVEGQTDCAGGQIRTCEFANGCLIWSNPAPCPGGQTCFGTQCAESCQSDPQCPTAAAKSCDGPAATRTCAEAAPGCFKLGPQVSCSGGGQCSGAGECSCNGCTKDGACAAGNQTSACGKGGGACDTCGGGEICNDGTCECTGCVIDGTCHAAGSDKCCGATKIDCTQVRAICSNNTNCVCRGTKESCYNGSPTCQLCSGAQTCNNGVGCQ